MSEQESEIPVGMALAWGVAQPASRGPKRTLSLAQVLDAGIALAVEDGIAAVSMARVADRVGVSTMALYRYVPSKDDLLELMVDRALGAPPDLPDGTTWRAGLRLWAESCRDRYRLHPWSLKVPISGPPLGPNNVRWLEFGLAALRNTALSDGEKLSSVLLVSAFVRGEEAITTDILARIKEARRPLPDYDLMLRRLIDPATFPELDRALNSGALRDEDPDDIGMDAEFRFGLDRILDGVEALVRATRRT